MIEPQQIWILGRAVVDTALMLLWGSFGFVSVAAPQPLRAALTPRVAVASALCITMAVAGVLMLLPAQFAVITGDWRATIDPQTLWSFLTLTSGGQQWIVLATGGSLLVLSRWLIPHQHALLAILAGASLASLSLTGHAAMAAGPERALLAGIDIMHVLSAGAWIGCLVGFVLVMCAARDPVHRHDTVVALCRFSLLGHFAVALVIISGIANSLLILGHFPTDWGAPYQARLLVKIGLVAIMTLAAIVNRYVFVPLLRRKRKLAETALLAGAGFELLLGVAVIALVAAFGTMDPT